MYIPSLKQNVFKSLFWKEIGCDNNFRVFPQMDNKLVDFWKKRPVFEFTQTGGVLECDCMGTGVLFMNARVLLCTVDKWNDQMFLDRDIIKFYVKHISLCFLI